MEIKSILGDKDAIGRVLPKQYTIGILDNGKHIIVDNNYIPYEKEYVKLLKKYCDYHLSLPEKQHNEIKQKILKIREEEFIFSHNQDNEKDYSKGKENQKKIGYIYLIECQGKYKIGRSKYKQERYKAFNVEMPFKFNLVSVWKSLNMRKSERMLHNYFSEKRINGEWFCLDKDDIDLINNFFCKNEDYEMINKYKYYDSSDSNWEDFFKNASNNSNNEIVDDFFKGMQ